MGGGGGGGGHMDTTGRQVYVGNVFLLFIIPLTIACIHHELARS
jgi:hypothetical protein